MQKQWQYLVNQFLNATEENFKKAVKLSNYHDANLNTAKVAEVLLAPIYTRYHALHLTLVSEYTGWKTAGGKQQGQTLNVEQQIALAYGKMNLWDVQIQGAYLKGTAEYKAIFPDGRKPFISGSIDDRINAFDSLGKNLTGITPLAATKTAIDAAYTTLSTARDAQESAKGGLKTGSGKVEAARIAAMNMMYRDLGFCMDAYWDKPDFIASLFDLATLRDTRQTEFTGTLDPSENEAILVHPFLPDEILMVENLGDAAFNLYLASRANGADSNAVEIAAKSVRSVPITDFRIDDYSTHRYLTAVNQSDTMETGYVVGVE